MRASEGGPREGLRQCASDGASERVDGVDNGGNVVRNVASSVDDDVAASSHYDWFLIGGDDLYVAIPEMRYSR